MCICQTPHISFDGFVAQCGKALGTSHTNPHSTLEILDVSTVTIVDLHQRQHLNTNCTYSLLKASSRPGGYCTSSTVRNLKRSMSAVEPTGGPSTTSVSAPWPVGDVVYVAIVGTVMLAALLEWLLWLLAFLYCLLKAYQKANGKGKWSIRLLAILNSIFFIGMRCIFLPIMAVTLPLPSRVVQYFPEAMVSTLQWFAFWSFAVLLTVPWLFCVYQLVTHNIGRTRRIKTVLDEYSAPKVVVIMPCYNEKPEVLLRTVDSIVDCV